MVVRGCEDRGVGVVVVLGDDENILELDGVMVAQFCEYA